jgi:O-antigen/teichoic acid export membrane protein
MSIRQVSLPAFSRLADDSAGLEDAFSHSLTLAAGLAVLGGVLLASLAEPVVGILYGSKWLPAVVALQWLAIFGALRVIFELCYDFLVAIGRAGALLKLQIGWLTALVVALPLGAHLGGIAGVAIAQGIVAMALVLPLNIWLLVKSGLRLGPLAHALQPVALAAMAGAAVALLALQVDAPRGIMLGGAGILVTLSYSATFLASHRGRAALRWSNPPFFSRRTSSVPSRAAAARV